MLTVQMRMKKFIKASFYGVFLLQFLLLFVFPTFSLAQEPKLTWDPPIPATDILGYRVYIGMSPGQYTRVVDVGNQTEVPLSALDIPGGVTYYLAVKSYSATQESPGFSNEINTDYLLVSTGNGTVITETQGGPFQSSLKFYLKNLGSRTLTWRASTPDSWLSLSPAEGSLYANETVSITASIHSSAASFLP
ncbi:MAG: Di-glucose binding within endoplasmic reticulum [Deltaproteobacteria bacterium]|nr:Di-glucose binding within endoplasmic reticulum [Deltaproteobacteria bacterium]